MADDDERSKITPPKEQNSERDRKHSRDQTPEQKTDYEYKKWKLAFHKIGNDSTYSPPRQRKPELRIVSSDNSLPDTYFPPAQSLRPKSKLNLSATKKESENLESDYFPPPISVRSNSKLNLVKPSSSCKDSDELVEKESETVVMKGESYKEQTKSFLTSQRKSDLQIQQKSHNSIQGECKKPVIKQTYYSINTAKKYVNEPSESRVSQESSTCKNSNDVTKVKPEVINVLIKTSNTKGFTKKHSNADVIKGPSKLQNSQDNLSRTTGNEEKQESIQDNMKKSLSANYVSINAEIKPTISKPILVSDIKQKNGKLQHLNVIIEPEHDLHIKDDENYTDTKSTLKAVNSTISLHKSFDMERKRSEIQDDLGNLIPPQRNEASLDLCVFRNNTRNSLNITNDIFTNTNENVSSKSFKKALHLIYMKATAHKLLRSESAINISSSVLHSGHSVHAGSISMKAGESNSYHKGDDKGPEDKEKDITSITEKNSSRSTSNITKKQFRFNEPEFELVEVEVDDTTDRTFSSRRPQKSTYKKSIKVKECTEPKPVTPKQPQYSEVKLYILHEGDKAINKSLQVKDNQRLEKGDISEKLRKTESNTVEQEPSEKLPSERRYQSEKYTEDQTKIPDFKLYQAGNRLENNTNSFSKVITTEEDKNDKFIKKSEHEDKKPEIDLKTSLLKPEERMIPAMNVQQKRINLPSPSKIPLSLPEQTQPTQISTQASGEHRKQDNKEAFTQTSKTNNQPKSSLSGEQTHKMDASTQVSNLQMKEIDVQETKHYKNQESVIVTSPVQQVSAQNSTHFKRYVEGNTEKKQLNKSTVKEAVKSNDAEYTHIIKKTTIKNSEKQKPLQYIHPVIIKSYIPGGLQKITQEYIKSEQLEPDSIFNTTRDAFNESKYSANTNKPIINEDVWREIKNEKLQESVTSMKQSNSMENKGLELPLTVGVKKPVSVTDESKPPGGSLVFQKKVDPQETVKTFNLNHNSRQIAETKQAACDSRTVTLVSSLKEKSSDIKDPDESKSFESKKDIHNQQHIKDNTKVSKYTAIIKTYVVSGGLRRSKSADSIPGTMHSTDKNVNKLEPIKPPMNSFSKNSETSIGAKQISGTISNTASDNLKNTIETYCVPDMDNITSNSKEHIKLENKKQGVKDTEAKTQIRTSERPDLPIPHNEDPIKHLSKDEESVTAQGDGLKAKEMHEERVRLSENVSSGDVESKANVSSEDDLVPRENQKSTIKTILMSDAKKNKHCKKDVQLVGVESVQVIPTKKLVKNVLKSQKKSRTHKEQKSTLIPSYKMDSPVNVHGKLNSNEQNAQSIQPKIQVAGLHSKDKKPKWQQDCIRVQFMKEGVNINIKDIESIPEQTPDVKYFMSESSNKSSEGSYSDDVTKIHIKAEPMKLTIILPNDSESKPVRNQNSNIRTYFVSDKSRSISDESKSKGNQSSDIKTYFVSEKSRPTSDRSSTRGTKLIHVPSIKKESMKQSINHALKSENSKVQSNCGTAVKTLFMTDNFNKDSTSNHVDHFRAKEARNNGSKPIKVQLMGQISNTSPKPQTNGKINAILVAESFDKTNDHSKIENPKPANKVKKSVKVSSEKQNSNKVQNAHFVLESKENKKSLHIENLAILYSNLKPKLVGTTDAVNSDNNKKSTSDLIECSKENAKAKNTHELSKKNTIQTEVPTPNIALKPKEVDRNTNKVIATLLREQLKENAKTSDSKTMDPSIDSRIARKVTQMETKFLDDIKKVSNIEQSKHPKENIKSLNPKSPTETKNVTKTETKLSNIKPKATQEKPKEVDEDKKKIASTLPSEELKENARLADSKTQEPHLSATVKTTLKVTEAMTKSQVDKRTTNANLNKCSKENIKPFNPNSVTNGEVQSNGIIYLDTIPETSDDTNHKNSTNTAQNELSVQSAIKDETRPSEQIANETEINKMSKNEEILHSKDVKEIIPNENDENKSKSKEEKAVTKQTETQLKQEAAREIIRNHLKMEQAMAPDLQHDLPNVVQYYKAKYLKGVTGKKLDSISQAENNAYNTSEKVKRSFAVATKSRGEKTMVQSRGLCHVNRQYLKPESTVLSQSNDPKPIMKIYPQIKDLSQVAKEYLKPKVTQESNAINLKGNCIIECIKYDDPDTDTIEIQHFGSSPGCNQKQLDSENLKTNEAHNQLIDSLKNPVLMKKDEQNRPENLNPKHSSATPVELPKPTTEKPLNKIKISKKDDIDPVSVKVVTKVKPPNKKTRVHTLNSKIVEELPKTFKTPEKGKTNNEESDLINTECLREAIKDLYLNDDKNEIVTRTFKEMHVLSKPEVVYPLKIDSAKQNNTDKLSSKKHELKKVEIPAEKNQFNLASKSYQSTKTIEHIHEAHAQIHQSNLSGQSHHTASLENDDQHFRATKYFNSNSIRGRANAAKATFVFFGLLSIYFFMRPKQTLPPLPPPLKQLQEQIPKRQE